VAWPLLVIPDLSVTKMDNFTSLSVGAGDSSLAAIGSFAARLLKLGEGERKRRNSR
jgi:hypothetical protein